MIDKGRCKCTNIGSFSWEIITGTGANIVGHVNLEKSASGWRVSPKILRGEGANIIGPFTSSFYQTSSGGVLLEAVTYIRVAFLEVPATTFFSSKIKNDPRHGGICCSRRRVKKASRKRQPRDGANLASSHFFAKKR